MFLTQADTDADVADVATVLSRSNAKTVLEAVDEPLSAKEVSHLCDVPLSSAYRLLDELEDVDLVESRIEIDPVRGKHVQKYARAFESIEIKVTDGGVAVQVLT